MELQRWHHILLELFKHLRHMCKAQWRTPVLHASENQLFIQDQVKYPSDHIGVLYSSLYTWHLNKDSVTISCTETTLGITWWCICFSWYASGEKANQNHRIFQTSGGGKWATLLWKVAGSYPASPGQSVMNILLWPQRGCGGSRLTTIGKGL